MAIQNRGQVPGLYDNVDKIVTGLIEKHVKEITAIHPKIFGKMTSTKKFERFLSTAPFGDVPEKPEGTPYFFDIIQQGYQKDVTPLEWGLGFEVTETAEEDDQYDELAKKTKYLMFSMRQVEDKQAAAVLYNGFTTQLTADALPLFDAAHTLKRGGTARNELAVAADLTIDSLAQAFIDLGTQTKIESGHLGMPPTQYKLVVPQAQEFIAHRVVKTTAIPGSADNDINPVKVSRQIEIVVNPFLDAGDDDAWYLVPADDDRHGLVYLQRKGITMAAPGTDERTGNRLYKLRARKTWDSIWWQNTFASPGA